MGIEVSYAIVFVKDMKRSVAFYRDTLGIPMRFESPEWTEFATGGATLALHYANADPRDSPGDLLAAGSCRPGLRVDNLDEFHKRMIAQEVHCSRPPENIHGTMVAEYVDPDGLPFSVSGGASA